MFLISVRDGANHMAYRCLVNCIIGNDTNTAHILQKCVEYCKETHINTNEIPDHQALHYKLDIFRIEGDIVLYKNESIFNDKFLRVFKGVLSLLHKMDVIHLSNNSVLTYILAYFKLWYDYEDKHSLHLENAEDVYQSYIYPVLTETGIKFNFDSTTQLYKNGTKFCYTKFIDTAYKLYRKEDNTISKHDFQLIANCAYTSMLEVPQLVVLSMED